MRIARPSLVVDAVIAVTLVSGCGQEAITRHTAKILPNNTQYPKRIVSLAPSVTEVLFSLGLGDRVVGVTKQCNYPPEALKKFKIGDMTTSTELVVSQNPDLVIGHALLNDKALAASSKLHIKTFSINPKTLADVVMSIQSIASACGVRERGDAIAKKMAVNFEAIQKSHSTSRAKPVVMFVVQGRPLFVAGSSTFVHEMINLAGGRNITNNNQHGFFQMSQEVALQNNPDIIFVTDQSSKHYFESSPIWSRSAAVRLKQVFLVNPDLYLRPTERLVEGLRHLYQKLHSIHAARKLY